MPPRLNLDHLRRGQLEANLYHNMELLRRIQTCRPLWAGKEFTNFYKFEPFRGKTWSGGDHFLLIWIVKSVASGMG
jgi:hypothetical protein